MCGSGESSILLFSFFELPYRVTRFDLPGYLFCMIQVYQYDLSKSKVMNKNKIILINKEKIL